MAFMIETMENMGTMANNVKLLRAELLEVETAMDCPTMANPLYRNIVAKYSRTIAHKNGIQAWSIGENYPFQNDENPEQCMQSAIVQWRMALLDKIMEHKMSIMATMAKLGAKHETLESILGE